MSRLLKGYENQITQEYKKGVHNGIDLVGYKSKTCYILAHSDGVIVDCKNNCDKNYKTGNSYGNYVKIKHYDGYYTFYAHLKYKSVTVKKGDNVKQGDVIGYMGNTGHSLGAHLHWEVRNEKDVRINPTPYLESNLPNEFTAGTYILLKSKAIRKDHTISNNIVKVKECKNSIKPLLTSKKPNDNAYFKIGVNVNITEIYTDKTKRVWGKLTNTWIVLCNKDGKKQAKKK